MLSPNPSILYSACVMRGSLCYARAWSSLLSAYFQDIKQCSNEKRVGSEIHLLRTLKLLLNNIDTFLRVAPFLAVAEIVAVICVLKNCVPNGVEKMEAVATGGSKWTTFPFMRHSPRLTFSSDARRTEPLLEAATARKSTTAQDTRGPCVQVGIPALRSILSGWGGPARDSFSNRFALAKHTLHWAGRVQRSWCLRKQTPCHRRDCKLR
mmetsp:Transcript_28249/g.61848  ORF Transcript_28249/g.61848 Transcript_28249/m.61848 type:complete len:209 (+) Transcript_28249:129-755(+)|eukprot:6196861-Pleurochrysis_carterae.AAC.5